MQETDVIRSLAALAQEVRLRVFRALVVAGQEGLTPGGLSEQLGIAPNMLARRLETLVREGLLARRQYCERPPRFEYLLTDRGREFRPVMLALLAWGNRHFSPEGESVLLVDRQTGATVVPILVDAQTGHPITDADHVVVAGPAASEGVRAKLEKSARARAASIPDVPQAAVQI